MLAAALENGGRDNITIIVLNVARCRARFPRGLTDPSPSAAPARSVHRSGPPARCRPPWCFHWSGDLTLRTPDPAAPPEPRRRGPLPVLASIVPLVGGVVMWLVTGSLLGLCFAALGPLMAVASLVDGARTARRDRRRAEREGGRRAHKHRGGDVARGTRVEREALDARHPDVARLLQRPERVWRPVAGRHARARGRARVGGQRRPSHGGRRGAAGAGAAARRRARDDPRRAGVCVQGPPVVARAVLRALVVQLCLAHAPEALTIVAAPASEDGWISAFPHRVASAASPSALRLAVVGPATRFPRGRTSCSRTRPRESTPDAVRGPCDADRAGDGRAARGAAPRRRSRSSA